MADDNAGDTPEVLGSLFSDLNTVGPKKNGLSADSGPGSEQQAPTRKPAKRTKRRAAPAPVAAQPPVSQGKVRVQGSQMTGVALGIVQTVRADQLVLHPDLDITATELEGIASERIEEVVDQLRRGIAPAEMPRAMVLGDGQFGALTGLETVVAAQRVSAKHPALHVTVLVAEPLTEADGLVAAMHNVRGKSGWEQYREIMKTFGDGGVRAKLRELDLPIKQWESRVSKVLKVGRLDPDILRAVNKLTIQVKEAGQVVDGWADPAKRLKMERVLGELVRGTNSLLDARPLFRALLKVGRPEITLPTWTTNEGGDQVFATADGTVLATLTVSAEGWLLHGRPMTAEEHRAMISGLPPTAAAA